MKESASLASFARVARVTRVTRIDYVSVTINSYYCFTTNVTYRLAQVKWFTTVIRFEPEVLPRGSCHVRLSNHLRICMRSETRLLDREQTWLIAVFVLRPNLNSLCLHGALLLLCVRGVRLQREGSAT